MSRTTVFPHEHTADVLRLHPGDTCFQPRVGTVHVGVADEIDIKYIADHAKLDHRYARVYNSAVHGRLRGVASQGSQLVDTFVCRLVER
jgi:hypothetical protein